jgi:hypothetical protein
LHEKMKYWLENRKALSEQMKKPVEDMIKDSLRNAEIAKGIVTKEYEQF